MNKGKSACRRCQLFLLLAIEIHVTTFSTQRIDIGMLYIYVPANNQGHMHFFSMTLFPYVGDMFIFLYVFKVNIKSSYLQL